MSYAAAGQQEVRMHADRHARRPASAIGWPNREPRVAEESFSSRLQRDPKFAMRLCASQILAHAFLGNEAEVEYWKGIYAKWEAAWKRTGANSANAKLRDAGESGVE